MELIKEVYVRWQAEVVFITSNWQGNKEMMEGCKAAGIPALVGVAFLPSSTGRLAYCTYPARERSGTFDSRPVNEILAGTLDCFSRPSCERLYRIIHIISYRQCRVDGGVENRVAGTKATSYKTTEGHGVDVMTLF